ncbi:MAG: LamG domain-containing protein, partial [Planctomycetota bacterium]
SVALSDFAGINAEDIRKLFVGFGNREEHPVAGGSGSVYFDDIRLYRRTCIPTRLKPAGDFDDDCTVDFTDVMLMADDWLRTDVNFADLGITVVEPSTDGLVGWWKLDDGDGNTAADWSSYAVQGTVEGRYSWVTGFDGVNGAVEFSGDGGRVLVPDGAHLRPADKVTATAWVYYPKSQNHDARIVCKGADNKETFGMEINSNDRFLFRVRSDGNTSQLPGYDVNSASGYLRQDEWIHLAGTFDGAADTVKCYVNGQVVDRRDDVNFVSALGKTLSQDTKDLGIGNRSDSTNREFIGVIDDVRVYSRALSEAEIGWLASDGSGYVPLRSRYNIYDLEPADKPQSINLRDLTVLANDWLKTKLWPPEP